MKYEQFIKQVEAGNLVEIFDSVPFYVNFKDDSGVTTKKTLSMRISKHT